MKAKIALGLFSVLVMVLSLATFASAQTVPVSVVRAEIDNTRIDGSTVNKLDIERNDEFTLKLNLLSVSDAEDVEVRAFISGYEFNDVNSISSRIGPFDFDANVTYVKSLKLALPEDVDVDSYKLRIDISDRNGLSRSYTYDLKVSTARHSMKIEDVTLSPGNTVQAGNALLVTVRVENMGQNDEDDVKVVVSIPSLAVSASEYIEEVEADEEEETEELFIKLPKCAEPGQYEAKIDVWFNEGHDKVSGTGTVNVLENPACKPEPAPVVVVQPVANNTAMPVEQSSGKIRSALEIILLVLVALLVVVGLIIGFSRMRDE